MEGRDGPQGIQVQGVEQFDAMLREKASAHLAARQRVNALDPGAQSIRRSRVGRQTQQGRTRHVDRPRRLGDDMGPFLIQQAHGVLCPGLQHVERIHDPDEAARPPLHLDAVVDDPPGERRGFLQPGHGVEQVQHVDVAHLPVWRGQTQLRDDGRAAGLLGQFDARLQGLGQLDGMGHFAKRIAVVRNGHAIRLDAEAAHPETQGLTTHQHHLRPHVGQEPIDGGPIQGRRWRGQNRPGGHGRFSTAS